MDLDEDDNLDDFLEKSTEDDMALGYGVGSELLQESEDGGEGDIMGFSRYGYEDLSNTGMGSIRYTDDAADSAIVGWGAGASMENAEGQDEYNFDISFSGNKKKKKKKKKVKRDKEKERLQREARERELNKSKDQRLEELLGQVSNERKAAKEAMELEKRQKEEMEKQRIQIEKQRQLEMEKEVEENEEYGQNLDNSRFMSGGNGSVTSDSLNLSSTDFEVGGYEQRNKKLERRNQSDFDDETGDKLKLNSLDTKPVFEDHEVDVNYDEEVDDADKQGDSQSYSNDGMLLKSSNDAVDDVQEPDVSDKGKVKKKILELGEEGLEKTAVQSKFTFADISSLMQKSPDESPIELETPIQLDSNTSPPDSSKYLDRDEDTGGFEDESEEHGPEGRNLDQEVGFDTRAEDERAGPMYQIGERVQAKIPEWKNAYWGVVTGYNHDTKTYCVDFDDGEKLEDLTHDEIIATAGEKNENSRAYSEEFENEENSQNSASQASHRDDIDQTNEGNLDTMQDITVDTDFDDSRAPLETRDDLVGEAEFQKLALIEQSSGVEESPIQSKDDIIDTAEFEKLNQNFRYEADTNAQRNEETRPRTPEDDPDEEDAVQQSELVADEQTKVMNPQTSQAHAKKQKLDFDTTHNEKASATLSESTNVQKPKATAKSKFWEGMKRASVNENQNSTPPKHMGKTGKFEASPPPPPPPFSSSKFRGHGQKTVKNQDDFFYLNDFPPPPPPERSNETSETGRYKVTSPANRYAGLSNHNEVRSLNKSKNSQGKHDHVRGRDIQYLQAALNEAEVREESLLAQLEQHQYSTAEAWKRCGELETEVESLKAEIFSLENTINELKHATPARLSLNMLKKSSNECSSTEKSNITISDIQKELEEQEHLLQGYQKENEKLVAQLREVEKEKVELKKKMLKEHQKLGMELNATPSKASSAEEFRKKLGIESEMERLRNELNEEKNANKVKQKELKDEMDKLRREKRDLECKLGGIGGINELEGAKGAETLEVVETLRKELAEARYEHLTEAKMLKDKLKWYAENQDLIDANDKLINEQREMIKKLKLEVNSGENASIRKERKSNNNRSLLSDIKRIRSLEKQVKELEEALNKRNPDCLANLIRAAGPSEEDVKAKKNLELKISLLEDEIKERETEANKRVRALRQEHEKVKMRYEKLLKDSAKAIGDEESNHQVNGRLKENHGKVQSLEEELLRVRNFYRKKIEELCKKNDVAVRNAKRGGDQGKVSVTIMQRESDKLRSEKTALAARVEELESELSLQQNNTNKTRRKKAENATIKELKAENALLKEKLNHHNKKTNDDIITRNEPLSLLDAVEAAEESSLTTTSNSKNCANSISISATEHENVVKTLQEKLHDSEVSRKAIEKLLIDQKSQFGIIDNQDKENSRAIGNMNNVLNNHSAQVRQLQEALERNEVSFNKLFKENQELHAQLDDAKLNLQVPQTPSMLHHQALLRRIDQMEYRHNNRERELERIVQQVKQRAELDIQLARANFENTLTQKNAEIKRFQIELNNIMQEVKRLHLF